METKKRNLADMQQGALQRLLPGPGELCQDAEGNMYQVIGQACHSKTGEEMVIYQALYGDYRWYACPAPEFCLKRKAYVASASTASSTIFEPSALDGSKKAERTEDESQIREELLLFLDAEDAGEKLAVLRTIRKKLDESLLTSIELSLDLIPDERESQERRLDLIERTLEKRVKYEGSRLRTR